MTRTVQDTRLETRTARALLRAQTTIYWRALVPGELHLGYRRKHADAPGIWIARRHVGKVQGRASPYVKHRLGRADDYQDADDFKVLSFAQAQARAFAWEASTTHAQAVAGPLTVRDACDDYLAYMRAERKTAKDAERTINGFILPVLGDLKVSELTTERLVRWRDDLASRPPRARTKPGKAQQYRAAPATAEARRARRATVNRIVTNLKGALNRAFRAGRVNDDLAWRRLESFKMVDVARPDYLSVAESQRLINAADEASGFRALVQGALLTGCRYGELCRMNVGDFQRGRVVVRESKTGRPRDVRLTEEGVAFFRGLTVGRAAGAPLFPRADGERWATSYQKRPMRDACVAARMAPFGFHQLRHTWASLAIMNGTPLLVVAGNLGHSDTRMVEKHYGHLTEDYRDEAIRAGAPRYGIVSILTSVSSIEDAA